MAYTSSVAISGPPNEAIKVARDALVANGFAIVKATPTEFTATGPGLTSSNQNPVLGASSITLRAESGMIHLQAELGGAVRLGLFVIIFPLALGLFLAAVFHLALKTNVALVPALAVAPWLVIGPLMAVFFRKRTQNALDALLQSAATIADGGSSGSFATCR